MDKNNKYDKNSAYLTIQGGAGGEDAKDWANMLFRMYFKYATKNNWQVIELEEGEILIKGEGAYGKLKSEYGVHRLVRISPFSAKNLRHTSFALVEITPELPKVDEDSLLIDQKDLKIDISNAGGPGGQNVNKRETAVRVVHLPTGISVSSRTERSQLQNKERAMSLLKSKLFSLLQEKHLEKVSELKTRVNIEWGSQIRSYVLHPYHQVKDHRTGTTSHQPEKVLEGNLDIFLK